MTDKSAASIKAERAARPAIELAQDGAELSPKNPCDLSHAHLRLGIDVGSTTVKLAVIDDNDHLVYANYERHHTDVRATAKELFARAQRVIGDTPMRVSITGSGGMLLAKWLDLEFVQEVIASKTRRGDPHSANRRAPSSSAARTPRSSTSTTASSSA